MANRILEDYSLGLRAYTYQYASLDGVSGTVSVLSSDGSIVPPPGVSAMLKSVGETYQSGDHRYDTYHYFAPDNNGDFYMVEKAIDTVIAGEGKALEFWHFPNPVYGNPIQDDGWNLGVGALRGTQHLGTYSMALSKKGAHAIGNPYEDGGYHGYNTWQSCINSNGNWIKLKTLGPGGYRSTGAAYPAARCVVTGGSGTFQALETINCSPSGVVLKFGSNITHDGATVVFGLLMAENVIPDVGDTLTGASSGATRTVSSVTQYNVSDHSGDSNLHNPAGFWNGYYADWMTKGGMTQGWAADYPNVPMMERQTRFYLGTAYNGIVTLPSTNYYADFRLIDDDRDDARYCQNIGAFYDKILQKLYVTFDHNRQYGRTTAEVAISYSDIHTSGFAAATLIKSMTAYEYYGETAIYETLTGTLDRDLYIAVRKDDFGDNFIQLVIPTSGFGETIMSGSTAQAAYRRMLKRNGVR